MKNAHAKRAKLLVVIVKYANLKCFELFLKSSKLLIDLISSRMHSRRNKEKQSSYF